MSKRPQTTRPPTLGAALAAAIRRRDLTAYRIARDCGVSIDSVQRWLNGERDIKLSTAERIAAHLELRLVDPLDP